MSTLKNDENLAYHAARILLLVAHCGRPRSKNAAVLPGIEGRTLLAKLDFFLRYPAYLRKAAEILSPNKEFSDKDFGLSSDNDELKSVESHMIRYLYGPWDKLYYVVLAYLIGKELIEVEMNRGVETFRLTDRGAEVSVELTSESTYSDLVSRANTAYKLFNKYKGTRLKDFIYSHFPEVVNRAIGAAI